MRSKSKKYQQLASLPNVYQLSNWNENIQILHNEAWSDNPNYIYQNIFWPNQKVILELCCAAGDYVIWLAKLETENIYIWVDIKWDRIYKWANIALENWLENVNFIRWDIRQLPLFLPKCIDEIWITFPDPQLAKENNRVTNPDFINIYKNLLKPNGKLMIKTDDSDFADYSRETLRSSWANIYIDIIDVVDCLERSDGLTEDLLRKKLSIITRYEAHRRKLGKKIQFIEAGW